ncbi:MAG: type II toxin-antitoxin system HicB family antitoxin, partial [Isosphaeraceae bacterium]
MNPTHHNYRGFVFSIEYVTDDPHYSVSFPDLPDIITSGATLTEAFGHACEDLYLEALQDAGRAQPKGATPAGRRDRMRTLMRTRLPIPCLAAILTVGLTLSSLLAGYEPVGGDPDLMYRPIKSELARSLQQGTLPFWSNTFGLGVPLVAESHVAAFYPPNWFAYRALSVSTAYRLLMWIHYVLIA